ncbi:CU044_2847 family protein [Nucisporomicrobium flavum]|jgi:Trypsin-co-occurring domain 1|uniref:CU044_2847 family protein n=1 Tax=Nucisporomicrobium flavum TaxID=2785915 RepID=UPI0018F55216|nr:CU044_2847 family protein [Nucisporomicrobium flavum]
MTYLVEFPLADGGEPIVVEMDDDQLSGFAPAAVNAGEVAATATESFESAVERLLPPMRAIGERLKELAPDELTVTLGVKLTAEAGVIVARTAGEANFTVTMKWIGGAT